MARDPTNRIVRCCNCNGLMRVATRALSVFCPHCQKRVSLEDLRIVGSHPGRGLATCGDILVEPNSRLFLELYARNVVIHGFVKGSVRAQERVEVARTGKVYGDVSAEKIIVHDGGVIQGRCTMTRSHPAQPPAPDRQEPRRLPAESEASKPRAAESVLPRRPGGLQIRPIQLD